jgi:hypothetical protein
MRRVGNRSEKTTSVGNSCVLEVHDGPSGTHTCAVGSQSALLHSIESVHAAPSSTRAWHLSVASQNRPVAQTLSSSHACVSTGWATHASATQLNPVSHALPSEHALPARGASSQVPLPAVPMHNSGAVQSLSLVQGAVALSLLQTPLKHSPCEHVLTVASLHASPRPGVGSHAVVVALHENAVWQSLSLAQVVVSAHAPLVASQWKPL